VDHPHLTRTGRTQLPRMAHARPGGIRIVGRPFACSTYTYGTVAMDCVTGKPHRCYGRHRLGHWRPQWWNRDPIQVVAQRDLAAECDRRLISGRLAVAGGVALREGVSTGSRAPDSTAMWPACPAVRYRYSRASTASASARAAGAPAIFSGCTGSTADFLFNHGEPCQPDGV
jgi:hypothetical protein